MNLSLCSIAIAALVLVQLAQGAPVARALPAGLAEPHAISSAPLSDKGSIEEDQQLLARGIIENFDSAFKDTNNLIHNSRFPRLPSLADIQGPAKPQITRTWSSLLDANKPDPIRDRVYVPQLPQKSSRVVDPSLELKPAPLESQLPLDAESADVRALLPENLFDLKPSQPRLITPKKLTGAERRGKQKGQISNLRDLLQELTKRHLYNQNLLSARNKYVPSLQQQTPAAQEKYDTLMRQKTARLRQVSSEQALLSWQIQNLQQQLSKLQK